MQNILMKFDPATGTVKIQLRMCSDAERRLFERNQAFLDMVSDPVNPLTNSDLKRLIERNPERYGTYSGFLGKLKD